MVEQAYHLLTRLPALPPDILQSLLPDSFDTSELNDYCAHSSHEASLSLLNLSGTKWNCLQVVTSVNTVIIRIALFVAWYKCENRLSRIISHKHVDACMGLLKLAFQLTDDSSADSRSPAWIIVKAFLWSSWQRVLMLYYWELLGYQLRLGYDLESNEALAIKGLASIPELFAQHNLQQLKLGRQTPYMCRWAYELLRNDRACAAMDLSRFHECYDTLFGDRPARCMDGEKQCDGKSSEACRRFTGTMTTNQSAHDLRCQKPCKKLCWDRQSFLSVVGPKAVCVNSTDEDNLRYCRASKQTIAISHVWSHGQGGRPDFGFNICLHRRYADLARSFGCDSYWMDTPCIPEEEPLRTECIKNINWIFNNSKVTLVCDKDLMEVDVAALTIELRESVLSILLVCDWNVRAWTLLEAMRGRNNIHLLCKGNQVICFKELLRSVHQQGRIDIITLFLTSQHLIPHVEPDDDDEILPEAGSSATDEDRRIQMGFISISEGSILLSHRHASRKGDDVLIWSLLVNQKAIKNVDQLWKNQLGTEIHTGFLLSSTPRIQGSRGLGWAPSSPTVQASPSLNSSLTGESVYLSYDGGDTGRGLMTVEGLQAKWLVHIFPTSAEDDSVVNPTKRTSIVPRIIEIAAKQLESYTWGGLLQPCPSRGVRTRPAQYRGNARGPLLAVCGSSDKRCWEWKGVYEWNTDVALPDFKIENILLV